MNTIFPPCNFNERFRDDLCPFLGQLFNSTFLGSNIFSYDKLVIMIFFSSKGIKFSLLKGFYHTLGKETVKKSEIETNNHSRTICFSVLLERSSCLENLIEVVL